MVNLKLVKERSRNRCAIIEQFPVILNLFQDLISGRLENKPSPQPSPIGEGAICHSEGACRSTRPIEFCINFSRHSEAQRAERIQPMIADGGQEVRRSGGQASLEGKKIRRYEGKLFSVNSLSSNPPTLLSFLNNVRRAAFTLAEGATHVDITDNVRHTAFTLAEVLITLGIIGIVAAMTMPALIAHYQRRVLETQFKKAYSEISQAVALLKVKEDINIFEYSMHYGNSQPALDMLMTQIKGASVVEGSKSLSNFISLFYTPKSLDKKSNALQYCDNTNVYRSPGGVFYSMDDSAVNGSLADPKLCIDINGMKKPNSYGHDLFVFVFTPEGELVPFTYKWNTTHTTEKLDDLSSQCSYTSGDYPVSCSYYALSDTSPDDSSKSYWKDFLR